MTHSYTTEAAKTNRLADSPTSLAPRIAKWTEGENRLDTSIQGLTLHRWETPTLPSSYMLAPSICLIGQGRKRLFLGEDCFVYDANQFLITSVELPVTAQVLEASPEKPYFGLTMELDIRLIAQLILDNGMPSTRSSKDSLGISIGEVSTPLIDAFNRLLDLLEHPNDIPALAPLIKQEIFYRLLTSEQGSRLRQITTVGSHGYQISRAIDWLKENFSKPIKVEELAGKVGLSVSAFHNHFRAMTSLSPLQFQKKMRLNEARRLMLAEHLDASRAAFEVGYESPSQFSREYSRLFGAPPMKDIKNLAEQASI